MRWSKRCAGDKNKLKCFVFLRARSVDAETFPYWYCYYDLLFDSFLIGNLDELKQDLDQDINGFKQYIDGIKQYMARETSNPTPALHESRVNSNQRGDQQGGQRGILRDGQHLEGPSRG
jgi:hypothetical protein